MREERELAHLRQQFGLPARTDRTEDVEEPHHPRVGAFSRAAAQDAPKQPRTAGVGKHTLVERLHDEREPIEQLAEHLAGARTQVHRLTSALGAQDELAASFARGELTRTLQDARATLASAQAAAPRRAHVMSDVLAEIATDAQRAIERVEQRGPVGRTGLQIQRQALVTAGVASAVAATPAVLVGDTEGRAGEGQLTQREFFARLSPRLEAAAAEVLGPMWTVAGCPYLKTYLAVFRAKPVAEVEAFARRLTGSHAKVAEHLLEEVVHKVRAGVAYWLATKQLPPDIAAADPAAARTAEAAASGAPAIQRKADGGQPAPGTSRPQQVMAQLGEGTPLDAATRARMEQAFGTSFDDVRIHNDAQGAALAEQEKAVAFAVGSHVAFAPGRYRPGTVEGDALLAHELTHVLQQRGATASASKDVSEVGDAAEQDADRGALHAVSQLHGGETASKEKAGAKVSSELQLQRCIGELNGGEQAALDAAGFWKQEATFEGDPFLVLLRKRSIGSPVSGVQNNTMQVTLRYTGDGDPSQGEVDFDVDTTLGKAIAPKVTFDRPTEWMTLTLDPHGDNTNIHTIRRTTLQLDGWNPRSRFHLFRATAPHSPVVVEHDITVKSKDALPGKTANTPVVAPDASLTALRVDIAATTTKRWLDELLDDPANGLDATAEPWKTLRDNVNADAAKYATATTDARDEAVKLTRLGQVLTRARPMLKALGLGARKEAYLPDIAADCVAMVTEVRGRYAKGIAAAWNGPATAELGAADTAFNAVWYRISSLYVQKGRGVNKLLGDARFALEDVRSLRGTSGVSRPGLVFPRLEMDLGVPGATKVGVPPTDKIQSEADRIRAAFIRGDANVLGRVEQVVQSTQVITGLAALLSTIELMYAMRHEMDGVVGTVADKLPGTRNLSRQCTTYITKLEGIARGLDGKLGPQGTIWEHGPAAISAFQGVCDDQFRRDCKDIQSRIKTVKTIEALGRVLAIVGVAALTGGAAGAAVGGALEGLGAGAAAVATGEFAAEVVAFTLVSRLGNDVLMGGNHTSLGEDLVTNALMFGFLKAAMAGYGRAFKAFADPRAHKTAFAVGGAMTGMVGLQVFAEVHTRLKSGKWMDGDERAVSVFSNAVMLACMALGGYLAKPQAERIRQDMLVFAAKNVPGALAKIEARLAGLKGELDGLKGKNGPGDVDRAVQVLQKIERLWNEQLSVLAEAAKLEKTKSTEAAKAFQDQVNLMVKEIAKLDLQLSVAGVEIDLGATKSGNFFRPLSPGFVAFREAGIEVLRDFYKANGGTFAEVKGKEGLYVGKDSSGEIFFVKEEVAGSFFEKASVKPPTEAEAKANRLAAEQARAQNKLRAQQLRKLLEPHLQDGHVTYKFGRVINGTGLAAAMDANTLPGASRAATPAALQALPRTIGLGTGQETFAKLGDTPIGQAAPEISGGGGWAPGATPADMTTNHGNYTSAASIADAVALTQLRSGVPILDATVVEVSLARDGTWVVADAKVRLKAKLADGAEVFIYADATDLATGLGPPRELDMHQWSTDPAKAAAYRTKLLGDGRLVYGDTVGVQKGGERVLVSGGSATGAWNARVARQLGALVDWIAKDSPNKAPPRSEDAARKYEQVNEQLARGELDADAAAKQLADLRAFDAAALPRNVQAADSAMNDAGIARHVKEIKSVTPSEEVAGLEAGKVKVTFSDGTSGIYDQVVVSHGTNLGAAGGTPGALSLAKGIQLRPVEVDGQVVALESVTPPGAVRIVGAAMWSRAWVEFIVEPGHRTTFENALQNQALTAPRDSPGNPLIHNTGRQIPAANRPLGGGPAQP